MKNTTKTNETGKSFEEILNELINDTTKKIAMKQAVDEAIEKMEKEMDAQGDFVMGSIEVEECPCERNCGTVQITGEFIAMTHTTKGLKVTEGTLKNILSMK